MFEKTNSGKNTYCEINSALIISNTGSQQETGEPAIASKLRYLSNDMQVSEQ